MGVTIKLAVNISLSLACYPTATIKRLDMSQTRTNRLITRQQAREQYMWIPILTTTLGTIASIAFLIYAAFNFPALIPNFGWPVFVLAATGGLPGLLLLAAAPGLNQPNNFSQTDVGGIGVLFGALELAACGLLISVGFTLLAAPAALQVATLISSSFLLAAAGGFLSLCAGVLIAESQAGEVAAGTNENRAEENNNNDTRHRHSYSPSPLASPSLSQTNRSSTQQLFKQMPEDQKQEEKTLAPIQTRPAPISTAPGLDRSSTAAKVHRQLPTIKLETKTELLPGQQQVTTPTAPTQSTQSRFSLLSSSRSLETKVETLKVGNGTEQKNRNRKLS
jgi:hypothetical protein